MRWPESPDLIASSRRRRPAPKRAALLWGRAGDSAAGLPVVLALLLAFAAATAGCGPRYARLTVHDRDGLNVLLRAERQKEVTVDRGFAHPVTISAARVTNILSRIYVRVKEKKETVRKPAIPAEFLIELGDPIAAALAKADPSQEVVVRAVRRERRLGIFTQEYLTSFVVYASGDRLFVHLARIDDPLPKHGDDTIPEPWPNREVMRFKVIASDGITRVAAQAVAVDWRNPLFRSPGQIRVTPKGKVMRREILLESPAEEIEAPTR